MTAFKIPFFGVAREFKAMEKPVMAAVKKTFASGQVLQGPPITELEERMANMTRRKFGVAVNSCTDALFFALVAAGVRPEDEVLVTDFSFIASASCITRAGAKPVFVDIGPDFNFDLKHAQALVSHRTRALIAVHLYGQMMDPAPFEAFCKNNNLILIEDTAQAFGSKWDGRPAGSIGLASCVSFDPTKPISSPGSGGIVVTDDEKIAEHVRRLRYHGRPAGSASFVELGYNAQMPSATAAVLNLKLKKSGEWLKKRRAIAREYIKGLDNIDSIALPKETKPDSHNYHKFVITLAARDALKAHLTAKSIETFIHYGHPLHRQPCFSALDYKDTSYPNSVYASAHVLSLPIHPFLSPAEIKTVIRAVREFASSSSHVRHSRVS